MDLFESTLTSVQLFVACCFGVVAVYHYYHFRQLAARLDGFLACQRVASPRIELIALGIQHEVEIIKAETTESSREILALLNSAIPPGQCQFGCHSSAIAGKYSYVSMHTRVHLYACAYPYMCPFSE
jgi:hypothetical protein